MAIHGIIGLPGHGKSTFASILAARLADTFARKARHRRVFANFPVADKRVGMIPTWEAAQELSNCVFFLDEAPNWFNRRNWNKNTEADLQKWKQSRKDGLTLFWIAHDISHVETQISEHLTESFWVVRRFFGPALDEGPSVIENIVGWRAVARQFYGPDYRRVEGRKHPRQSVHFRIDRQFDKFDSLYVVGGRDGEGNRAGRAQRQEADEVPVVDHPLVSRTLYGLRREELGSGYVRLRADVDLNTVLELPE
jgi:hypothetical protein